MVKTGQIRRHYKSLGGDNHTYEIIGIGRHSETQEQMVIYKALFNTQDTWLNIGEFAIRPIELRETLIEYNGQTIPRFTLIKNVE